MRRHATGIDRAGPRARPRRPAAAAETVTTIPGAPGPGPSKYDKAYVTKFAPSSAERVLVLMPGFEGGRGHFTLDARELVRRVPGLQGGPSTAPLAALEDTLRFDDALAGRITVQQAFDHYLGWLANPANALTRNAQTDYLKPRPWHRREVDLPLYALQTDLTGGRVPRGARFIAGSKVPCARSVLVDASSDESHLDPLTAAPARKEFLQTVVPFLRKLRRSAP